MCLFFGMISSTWGSSVSPVKLKECFSPNDGCCFSCSNSLDSVIDGLMSGFFGSASQRLKQSEAFKKNFFVFLVDVRVDHPAPPHTHLPYELVKRSLDAFT